MDDGKNAPQHEPSLSVDGKEDDTTILVPRTSKHGSSSLSAKNKGITRQIVFETPSPTMPFTQSSDNGSDRPESVMLVLPAEPAQLK